jgi:hypothetical protein
MITPSAGDKAELTPIVSAIADGNRHRSVANEATSISIEILSWLHDVSTIETCSCWTAGALCDGLRQGAFRQLPSTTTDYFPGFIAMKRFA